MQRRHARAPPPLVSPHQSPIRRPPFLPRLPTHQPVRKSPGQGRIVFLPMAPLSQGRTSTLDLGVLLAMSKPVAVGVRELAGLTVRTSPYPMVAKLALTSLSQPLQILGPRAFGDMTVVQAIAFGERSVLNTRSRLGVCHWPLSPTRGPIVWDGLSLVQTQAVGPEYCTRP